MLNKSQYKSNTRTTTKLVGADLSSYGARKWGANVLAKYPIDGKYYVYCIPSYGSRAVKIDVDTYDVTMLGTSNVTGSGVNNPKFLSATLTPDNYIYSALAGGSSSNYFAFLKINLNTNPETVSVQTIYTSEYYGNHKTVGSSLYYDSNDGKTYIIFYYGSSPVNLKFDISTETFTFHGGQAGTKFYGGCMASNKRVYFAMRDGATNNYMGSFYLPNMTYSAVGAYNFDRRSYGASMDFNENVYFAPHGNIGEFYEMLKINTLTHSSSIIYTIPTEFRVADACKGISLSPNGNLYTCPHNMDRVIEVVAASNSARLCGDALGSGGTKYTTNRLLPNGKILCIPDGANKMLEITPFPLVAPDLADLDIPSDLTTLHTSNYNRYFNKM